MIYVINEHLKYDPLSATLYSPEHHPDALTLSRVNNSIFLIFVNKNNELISRSYLLKEIWENQGIDSSNNNLNNHISILRKSLAQCGCDEIIKTIPKKGLMFSANTVRILNRKGEKKTVQDNVRHIGQEPLTPALRQNKFLRSPFAKLTLFTVTVLTILLTPFFYEKIKLFYLRKEILRIEQCRFYVTDHDTKLLSKEDIRSRIDVFMKNKSIDCSRLKANVYFSFMESIDAMGKDKTSQIISYCLYNSSAKCINYKEYHLK
ncbi:winged helix-turn-helix domain-containing protein [Serratia fonticola]|jgi:DNA-binding winged helix-turn-helix (wHTH) protein|uniref:winged helix-turn-helix domain-containing protein n=1 Tax=Serratia fonticola TaxID=47917 RepID=UPI0013790926|nr:helix-turn-helix domain-containing protein [Serratia fonticola]MBC3218446.1 helix-turn-helix domain-containing protein [Serratia fonticola]NCG52768.1 hypothetical protein [Serratia fonticola]